MGWRQSEPSVSLRRTTFIQNLLGPYAQQPDLAVNGVTGPEALRTFEHAPEKMATTVEVQDNNSLTNFFYSVQDTPGLAPIHLIGYYAYAEGGAGLPVNSRA